MTDIEKLRQMIKESERIVFLGGAGVSVESGIPDFRSAGGLYNRKEKYAPEEMLSHSFFVGHTEEFFDYYKHHMIYRDAKPNLAHYALAKLEKDGKLTAVVTQNIDGLHQAAGSQKVYELHGSVLRNYCMKCGKFYDLATVENAPGVPYCSCGGIIKPDVVLYEEALDNYTVTEAVKKIAAADMLIVGGTSLLVYPAAGLINYYRGDKLVLINKSVTPYDRRADLIIRDSIGKVLSEAVDLK